MSAIEQRLSDLGLQLPEASTPAANYVPYTISGNIIFISGQVPVLNGERKFTGIVGVDATEEDAVAAAQLCALNLLSQAKAACGGDLARLGRCLKLGGFVASVPTFTRQPQVINGASDLMVAAMGEAGRHARFAVGAPVLPMNVTVEVEGIFELA